MEKLVTLKPASLFKPGDYQLVGIFVPNGFGALAFHRDCFVIIHISSRKSHLVQSSPPFHIHFDCLTAQNIDVVISKCSEIGDSDVLVDD